MTDNDISGAHPRAALRISHVFVTAGMPFSGLPWELPTRFHAWLPTSSRCIRISC